MCSPGSNPPTAFISYAHDDVEHQALVIQFWQFLRDCGVEAVLDLGVADQPQDWPLWMARQVDECDFVLMVASPEYRNRAGGGAATV